MISQKTIIAGFFLVLTYMILGSAILMRCQQIDSVYGPVIHNITHIDTATSYPLFWMFGYNHTNGRVRDSICYDTIIDCTSKLTNLFEQNTVRSESDLLIGIPNSDDELDGIPINPALWCGLLLLPLIFHAMSICAIDNKLCIIGLSFIFFCISIGFIIPMEQNNAALNDLIYTGFHNATISGSRIDHNRMKMETVPSNKTDIIETYNCTSNIDCFQKIWKVWTNKEVGWVIVTNIYPYVPSTYMDIVFAYIIPISVLLWIILTTIIKLVLSSDALFASETTPINT